MELRVGEVWMEAAIRRNSDGETRIHRYPVNPEHVRSQPFWWGDGNGACDCNRYLFFERVVDEDFDCDEDDYDCGKTAYSVLSLTNCDTGEIVYKDGDRMRSAQ